MLAWHEVPLPTHVFVPGSQQSPEAVQVSPAQQGFPVAPHAVQLVPLHTVPVCAQAAPVALDAIPVLLAPDNLDALSVR